MASSFPPRIGTVFAERYQLRELLGSGGVGQVFRAWDVQAQRTVALKAFNPARCSASTWEGYVRVVTAAAPLRHPDLVLPQDLAPTLPSTPLAVMESLVGEDLATLRARLGRVPWQRALEIGARCAELLHTLYMQTGVAHRDLKAGNVFVTESGAVKLLDYGIAEFDEQSAERTRVDTALGIVDYKAPEQLESNHGDHLSDVFSLGVLVYEMIAGERPFNGPSYFEVARKILLEPAPLLSEICPEAGVTPAVDAFLHRALEKRPGDRYGDLEAMQHSFLEVLRGGVARSTVIAGTREAAMKGMSRPATAPPPPTPFTSATPPVRPGGRKPRLGPGQDVIQALPRAVSGGARQLVPSGARAVVASGDAPTDNTSRTVVASAPMDPRRMAAADDDDTTMAARTLIHGRQVNTPSRPPAESTMILGDHGHGPARPEATLMLSDDGAPRAEATLMLPEDGVPKAEGTLMLSDTEARPEGTMQLPGEAPKGPWTLQRILIVINVTCGVLILLGLLILLLGGEADPGAGK